MRARLNDAITACILSDFVAHAEGRKEDVRNFGLAQLLCDAELPSRVNVSADHFNIPLTQKA